MPNLMSKVHAVMQDRYAAEYRPHSDEWHADCPSCGKPVKTKQTHFAYRIVDDDFCVCHCHVCGFGSNLHDMARLLGIDRDTPAPSKPVHVSRKEAQEATEFPLEWACGLPINTKTCLGVTFPYSAIQKAWDTYKPVSAYSIEAWGLTIGMPPWEIEQRHERGDFYDPLQQYELHTLLYPVIRDNKLVMLRYRDLNDDKPAWKTRGTPKRLLGVEHIVKGADLYIGENFIDGILLREYKAANKVYSSTVPTIDPYTGQPDVAHVTRQLVGCEYTLNYVSSSAGAMAWEDGWVRPLVSAMAPRRVLIAMDNDEAGEKASRKILDSFSRVMGIGYVQDTVQIIDYGKVASDPPREKESYVDWYRRAGHHYDA